MYPNNRPNWLARLLNGLSVAQFRSGLLSPRHWVVMQVPGFRTGKLISCPLVVIGFEGERYLVSMLGRDANWVRNVRAAGGRAVLRHGDSEVVRLAEIPVERRAPIIRRYLDYAPAARPHIPVKRGAPLEEFERIADHFPVFQIRTEPAA